MVKDDREVLTNCLEALKAGKANTLLPDGSENPVAKMLLTVLGLGAEIERKNIVSRLNSGRGESEIHIHGTEGEEGDSICVLIRQHATPFDGHMKSGK